MAIAKRASVMGVEGTWYFAGTPIKSQIEEGWSFKLMRYSKYKREYEHTYNAKGYTTKLAYQPDSKVCVVMIPPGTLRR